MFSSFYLLGQSQAFSTTSVGVGWLYSKDAGPALELGLNTNLSERFSLNLRYANNTRSHHSFVGGVEYRFLNFRRLSASAGLDLGLFEWDPEEGLSSRRNLKFEMPFQLNYHLSRNLTLKGGVVMTRVRIGRLRSAFNINRDKARVGVYYSF